MLSDNKKRTCQVCEHEFKGSLVQALLIESYDEENEFILVWACAVCALNTLKRLHGQWFNFSMEFNRQRHRETSKIFRENGWDESSTLGALTKEMIANGAQSIKS